MPGPRRGVNVNSAGEVGPGGGRGEGAARVRAGRAGPEGLATTPIAVVAGHTLTGTEAYHGARGGAGDHPARNQGAHERVGRQGTASEHSIAHALRSVTLCGWHAAPCAPAGVGSVTIRAPDR